MSNESFLDFFKHVDMEDKTKEKITNLLESILFYLHYNILQANKNLYLKDEGWTIKDLLCFGSINETIDVFKPTLERAEAAKICNQ